jgi:hypothetical protein
MRDEHARTSRTSTTRALTAIALLAAALSVSTAATADEPARAETADAKVPFEAGRALVRVGRFAEAIREFEASIAIRPTVGAYLNLGDCNEKIGRYTSAVAAFEKAATFAETSGEPTRVAEARARGERLRPLASSVVLRPGKGLESAKLLLDGSPIEPEAPRSVDGGEHKIVVQMPCRLDYELRVTVGLRADARVVALSSDMLREDPACAPAIPVVRAPVEQPSSMPSTLVVVLGVGGLAFLGVGTAFAVDAAGKKSDLESACGSYPRGCPAARKGELDDLASGADRSATFATIGVIAGAALVGTAVAMYLFARPGRSTHGTAAAFAPAHRPPGGFRIEF